MDTNGYQDSYNRVDPEESGLSEEAKRHVSSVARQMNQRRKRRSHATSSHSTQESHRSQSNSDSEDIRTDKQVTPWAETEYRQPYNAQYGFTDIPLPQDRWASITDRTGLSPRSDVVRVITTTFYCPDTDRDGTTCKPDVIMKLSVNGRNFNRLVIPTEAENEKEDEITLYEVVDRSPKLVLRYELSDAGLSTQEKPQWLGNLTIPQNVEAVAEGCSTPTKLEVAQSILQQASEWYDHRILDAEHHTNVRQYSGSQAQWNSFTDGGYDSNRPPMYLTLSITRDVDATGGMNTTSHVNCTVADTVIRYRY